jgi:hypothetical protein
VLYVSRLDGTGRWIGWLRLEAPESDRSARGLDNKVASTLVEVYRGEVTSDAMGCFVKLKTFSNDRLD